MRSSRRLAREAARDVEVMWLLKDLRPGYRVPGLDPGIGDFRKDNTAALKATNRDFVLVLHELELLSGDVWWRSTGRSSTAMRARPAS